MLLAYERLDAAWQKRFGFGTNEKLVLLALTEEPPAAPTDLSRQLSMTTAGITNLLDRLEAGGYIRRDRHKTDGRRVLVSLTKKGLQARLQLEQVNTRLAARLDHLEGDAREACAYFLQQAQDVLAERMSELAGHDGSTGSGAASKATDS